MVLNWDWKKSNFPEEYYIIIITYFCDLAKNTVYANYTKNKILSV